ncbi:efflux RND transporter permease subunit [Gallibacterium melopsittaci]|uniref:Efflux RND transporter permease subunit n=1 Tax=Gallibacterium melopsittaci TaxID=516063 RepID=A0ABV6HVF2_9PAST
MVSGKFSSWSIRHPIPTIVLFLVLSIAGILAFQKLPINAEPNVKFPMVSVTISQSGASPEALENTVARRVENAVSGMAGVRHITSTITEGSSMTTVEFQLNVDLDRAVNDVRNAIEQIRDELPQNINNPTIERADIEGGALGYYAVQSPTMTQTELVQFIDDTVSRRLLSEPGVQQVKRLGGEAQEIRVELNAERLRAFGITADQVSQQLAQTNANIPAGRTQLYGQEQSIRVLGSSHDINALAALPIALADNRKVRLSELATVNNSHDEVRSITRLNGREVLGFTVSRSKGTSDTVVNERVQAALLDLAKQYPDVRIREVYNSVENTQENYHVAIQTLLEGAILTVLVVMLFLRNWRSTLIAAIALPLAILPTFIVMYLLDYTLNSISLLAITLVVGILVDDAIVEIENIEQHLRQGKRPYQAALDAADAIGFAVVAITATIVAVFLPVSFVGGTTGMYFSQFGVTIAAAVISSLLVARLATPLLAAYLLQPIEQKAQQVRPASILKRSYLAVLAQALHFRKTTLLIGGVFLIASLALIPLLPTGFTPKGDTGMSQINVRLPPSSTVQQTDTQLQKIEHLLRQDANVATVFTTIGGSGDPACTGGNFNSFETIA